MPSRDDWSREIHLFKIAADPFDRVERYTYHIHLRATLFEGVYMGAMWGAADIAARNMAAGPWAITLITMVPGAASLFSLFLIRRIDRMRRRKLIMTASFLGRLPIVAWLFFADIHSFIFLITLQSVANVAIISSWNSLLRTNYRDQVRGRLFGRVNRVQALLLGATSIGMGALLDHVPEALTWSYAVVALFGVGSCWVFARIQTRPIAMLEEAQQRGEEWQLPPSRFGVLGSDKAFRWFEQAFFLYGIAFMAAVTALPLFGAGLKLTNTEMLGARGLHYLCIAICTVHAGLLLDRMGPAKLAGASYLLLAVVMVCFAMTTGPISYILSYMLFGVAMAGVQLVWNMGPVAFAPLHEAGKYMGLHMALVGVRSMMGHPLGGWMVDVTGDPRLVFWFSCEALVLGALGMFFLAYKMGRPEKGLVSQDFARQPSVRQPARDEGTPS